MANVADSVSRLHGAFASAQFTAKCESDGRGNGDASFASGSTRASSSFGSNRSLPGSIDGAFRGCSGFAAGLCTGRAIGCGNGLGPFALRGAACGFGVVFFGGGGFGGGGGGSAAGGG